MKVRVYETEWRAVTTYETVDDPVPESNARPVEVPDEIIRAYDDAREAFNRAEDALARAANGTERAAT